MFNDFFGKAKDVAKVAGDKTNEVFEISKLKMKVSQINSNIKSLYEQIGKATYTMHKAGKMNDSIIISLMHEIDKLCEEKKLVENKIAVVKNMIICCNCGENNQSSFTYCSNCGEKLKSKENVETDPSNCEDKVDEDFESNQDQANPS